MSLGLGLQISNATSLVAFAPANTTPYSVTYLVVGGGGGGQDTQSGTGGVGGNGGAVSTGTLTLTPGVTYTLSAGVGGSAPGYGQAPGASSSASSNTELVQPGDGGLSKIFVGSTILAQAAGGYSGFDNGKTSKSGGFGGNGVNAPHSSYDENADVTTYYGGDGIPSSITGSLAYYGAGGGGGDPDNGDVAAFGATTLNYGAGGFSGNAQSGWGGASAGYGGVVILSIPSSKFGSTNGTASPDGNGNQVIITQGSINYTA